ncbi:MAG: hypothetical protein WBL70_16810 [Candidatus Acidiferrales bacterium]
MNKRATRFYLTSGLVAGLFGVATIAFPGRVHAQAAPGPIQPSLASTETAPASAASPAKTDSANTEAVPQKKDLSGAWKLNEDKSDDPTEKMKQARDAGGGYGGGNGGGNRNGGWGMGGPGGGMPGSGGGYGGRRGGMGGQESEEDREKIQEAINPASSLNFTQKDAEIDMTDDLSHKRVFYTDGRKIQKSKDKDKDEDYKELAARWEGYRLVADEKGPHGKITRMYEVLPGGRELDETVHFENSRGTPVTIRYVYDILKTDKPNGSSEVTIQSN